jgi:hypothetical protein
MKAVLVGALLVEAEHFVCTVGERELVGYNDYSLVPRPELADFLHEEMLVNGVQEVSRLVEYVDFGFLKKRPNQVKSLTLSTRQLVAVVAYDIPEAVWELQDLLVHTKVLAQIDDLLLRLVGAGDVLLYLVLSLDRVGFKYFFVVFRIIGDSNVVDDGVVKEVVVLWADADFFTESELEVFNVLAIKENGSALWIEEAV